RWTVRRRAHSAEEKSAAQRVFGAAIRPSGPSFQSSYPLNPLLRASSFRWSGSLAVRYIRRRFLPLLDHRNLHRRQGVPAMSTQQVATRLAELCRQGKFEAAQRELFAEDAVSVEQHESPQFPKETKGLRNIIEKGQKWNETVEEVHSCTVSQPLVAGNAF